MKNNYSLYYSYKTLGDVLLVVFDNEKKTTRSETKGDVVVLYHEEEIIGYNIFHLRNIVKIKTSGLIYLPSPTLIEVVNNILKNNNVEQLEMIKSSGYLIGEVKQINGEQTLINIGKDHVFIKTDNRLHIGDKVVIANIGTRLNNGQLVKDMAHLCNEKDLQISDSEEPLILDKEDENGKDFFTTEER